MRTALLCRRTFALIAVVFGAPGACETARSEEPAKAADAAPDYARDVKPLLTRKCYAYHGALKKSGGLRLDTRGVMLTGGDSGAAVVPQNAEKSLSVGCSPQGALRRQRVVGGAGHWLMHERPAATALLMRQGLVAA